VSQVGYFLTHVFSSAGWPPRWHCGVWSDFCGWLYIVSDVGIGLAYLTIPCLLVFFVKTQNAKFTYVLSVFATFILLCGSTHFVDAAMFWYPFYRVNAVLRLITFLVSWLTVVVMSRYIPTALQMHTAEYLEKKLKTDQARNLKQLYDSQRISQVGSWFLEIETGRVVWSEEMFRILGQDPRLPPPAYLEHGKWFTQETWDLVQRHIAETSITGVGYEVELEMTLGDTHRRWAIARGEVQRDEYDVIFALVGTLQEVTDRKLLELRLVNQAEELARSNRDLEQFAYIASHDLQEPLRAITGCLQLFKARHSDQLDPAAKDLLKLILDGGERMKSLISGLLSYSKVSRGKNVMPEVPLEKTLVEVRANLALALEDSKATLRVSALPTICGNPTQLVQLFQNLIGNALKYRLPDVEPIIDVTCCYTKEGWEVSVSDNGIGIDSAQKDKIFLIFQRLHNRDEYSGSGIGLAVCKKIVECHSGRIWVEPNPEGGSVFKFTLPRKRL
jgi:signal transduction histidine kinase